MVGGPLPSRIPCLCLQLITRSNPRSRLGCSNPLLLLKIIALLFQSRCILHLVLVLTIFKRITKRSVIAVRKISLSSKPLLIQYRRGGVVEYKNVFIEIQCIHIFLCLLCDYLMFVYVFLYFFASNVYCCMFICFLRLRVC